MANAICLSGTESDGDVRSAKSETVACEDKMKVEEDDDDDDDGRVSGYAHAQDDDDVFGEDA